MRTYLCSTHLSVGNSLLHIGFLPIVSRKLTVTYLFSTHLSVGNSLLHICFLPICQSETHCYISVFYPFVSRKLTVTYLFSTHLSVKNSLLHICFLPICQSETHCVIIHLLRVFLDRIESLCDLLKSCRIPVLSQMGTVFTHLHKMETYRFSLGLITSVTADCVGLCKNNVPYN